MRTSPQPHVAVVGGGLAGLAAAHRLLSTRPDLTVTVLESSPEVGGKLRLAEVAGQPVDVGAESILNRRPEGTALAREVGLGADVVHPVATAAGVWTRARLRRLPPTLMGVPADLGSAVREGVISRTGAVRALGERLRPRLDLSADVAVGRLVSSRLGPEIRDRLVEPMLGGVYAGHADELSVQATVPQLVDAVAEHGSLLAAAKAVTGQLAASGTAAGEPRTPVFAGVSGGVGRLAVETARAVARLGGTIRTDVMVRDLAATDSGFRLVMGPTRAAQVLDVEAVVIAVPGRPAAKLLRRVVPAAARELGRLEYASLAIVTLAIPAVSVPEAMRGAGSGFLVPPVDGRVIKAATLSSAKWGWLAGDTFVLRASIGRHREEATLQRDDTELVAAAMADLREAVGLAGPLLDALVTRWGGGLPQYAVGHLERVASIRDAVADVPGIAVCGAAYDGVGIPAVIASAQRASTQVLEHLAATATMGP